MSGLKPIPPFDISPKISVCVLIQRNIVYLSKLLPDPIQALNLSKKIIIFWQKGQYINISICTFVDLV